MLRDRLAERVPLLGVAIAASNPAFATPTPRAATFTRPTSIPAMNCLKPSFSCPPRTLATGVRKPSKTSSTDSTPL